MASAIEEAYKTQVAVRDARLAALEAALEPFANAAARYDDVPSAVTHDNVQLWQDGRRIDFLTVGNLRDARLALKRS